ncbi:hypothetical protein FOXYSP1_05073 [Fusarium oxysporum f. sp. phaseoli]
MNDYDYRSAAKAHVDLQGGTNRLCTRFTEPSLRHPWFYRQLPGEICFSRSAGHDPRLQVPRSMDMTSWPRAAHGPKEVWHVTAVVRSFDASPYWRLIVSPSFQQWSRLGYM